MRFPAKTQRRRLLVALVVFVVSIAAVGVLVWISIKGRDFPDWTGFGTNIVTVQTEKDKYTVTHEPRKTLWDLVSLLIVPAILAAGGYWLNESAKRRDRLNEENKAQETTLQNYLDKITELLLNTPPLGKDSPGPDKIVARSRTLTALSTLNGERKGTIIRFLYESGLINGEKPIIDLTEANLRGAVLNRAALTDVNLKHVKLEGAQLVETNLTRAELSDADLSNANLKGAILHGVKLRRANLSMATLAKANFHTGGLTDEEIESSPPEHIFQQRAEALTQYTQRLAAVIGEGGDQVENLNRENANQRVLQLQKDLRDAQERTKAWIDDGEDIRTKQFLRSIELGDDETAQQAEESLNRLKREDTETAEKLRHAERVLLEHLQKAMIKLETFVRADLQEATLDGADLSGSSMRYSNLKKATLQNARLQRANLSNADLTLAKLDDADLSFTVLSGAIVCKEQLSKAKSVHGAWRNGSRM